MRVFVYKNSRRKCWSLRACGGENDGRVIGYANFLVLKDCEFVVEQAGWKKYMETGTKNVHAGVRGTLVSSDSEQVDIRGDSPDPDDDAICLVAYNREGGNFVECDDLGYHDIPIPIYHAKQVAMGYYPSGAINVLAEKEEISK